MEYKIQKVLYLGIHWKMPLTELESPRNLLMTTYFNSGLARNSGLTSKNIRTTKLEF